MACNYKRIQGAVALLAATLALSACNTIAGAGADLSSAGHDMTRGAAGAQQGIHQSTGASTE